MKRTLIIISLLLGGLTFLTFSWGAPASVNVSSSEDSPRLYPNPWRVDQHDGKDVTFDRLESNSQVKIFTISGHAVRTLEASSKGTVLWDLTNEDGDRVASGIYLVLMTDTKGLPIKDKLAVIR